MFALISFKKSKIRILFICLFIAVVAASCHQKPGSDAEDTSANPKLFALQYLSQNKLDEAIAAFQQAIKMNPKDTSSYAGLVRLYLLQKDFNAAEKFCDQGLKNLPGDISLELLLAETYDQKNEKEKARNELNEIIRQDPKSIGAWYKLASLDTSAQNTVLRKKYLLKVQSLAPANIVPRLQLAELFARESNTDSSLFFLQTIKKMVPSFSDAAASAYEKAVTFLQANKPGEAADYIEQFHHLMEITPDYASGLGAIQIPNMVAGYFDFDTNIKIEALDSTHKATYKNNSFNAPLVFTDFPNVPGYKNANNVGKGNSIFAITDYDALGNIYLYSSYLQPGSTDSKSFLSSIQMGIFNECKVSGSISHKGQDLYATFSDYDNDGYPDLFVAATNGMLVYKNKGDGTFSKVTDNIGLQKAIHVTKILFADFDQDGDLDMYVAQKNGNILYRNNGDGTFTESSLNIGPPGYTQALAQMDFGDWDGDGDVDIAGVTNAGKLELFNNNRRSNFTDITSAAGLAKPEYTGTVVAFGDYNNDGRLDILLAGGADGKCFLFTNEGKDFICDNKASMQLTNSLKGVKVYDAVFMDYDNDGHRDIVIAGVNNDVTKKGVRLFHNDGAKGFADVTSILPETVTQAYELGVTDFNFDGDRDIFFCGPGGVQIARNDG